MKKLSCWLEQLRVGTPEQYRWLFNIASAVLAMNLVDTAFTVFWVSVGWATEANPLMDVLFEAGFVSFAVIKAALVSGGLYLLWRYRTHAWAVIGLFGVFLVYYAVVIVHADAASYAVLLLNESAVG